MRHLHRMVCFLFVLRLISFYDANSLAADVRYVYDELGRLVAVIDTAGQTAIYNYDAVGNLLSITTQSSSTVAILEFTPNNGPIGTTVTIWGNGFSATPSQNTVKFNGVMATITSSTVNQIVTSVPAGATTGTILVISPLGSATSVASFSVTASTQPTISSFNPSLVDIGGTVNVSGTNFSSIPSVNRAFVNMMPVQVTSSTATSLSFLIPITSAPLTPTVSSGKIRIDVPSGSVTSSSDLFIIPVYSPGNPAFSATFVGYTGRISIGSSQPISLNSGTGVGMILFDGTAGQQITLNVSGAGVPGDVLWIDKPDGIHLSSEVAIGASGVTLGPYILPSSGTYQIILTAQPPISTIAGTGTAGFSGDGGTATSAQINNPNKVAADSAGNLFIADTSNNRIRKINTSGTITTFAGTGVAGYSGDGDLLLAPKLILRVGLCLIPQEICSLAIIQIAGLEK